MWISKKKLLARIEHLENKLSRVNTGWFNSVDIEDLVRDFQQRHELKNESRYWVPVKETPPKK